MDRDVVSGLELVMKRVRRGGVCFMQISRKLRLFSKVGIGPTGASV
jgi:hypothetical protein